MTPYFLLVFLPIMMRMLNKKIRINFGEKLLFESNLASINIFMLLFLVLLAFRGLQCGIDTLQYARLFDEYSSKDLLTLLESGSNEIGYKIFNKIIGEIFGDYQFVLIATSLMCVIPIWYYYKHESDMPLLTISLFLSVAPFCVFFSGIRQTVAIAFGILAWYAAKSNKLLLSILIVFFAMQFHTSAFVLLIIYPLYHAKITRKSLLVVLPFMVAIYIFRSEIFDFLFSLLWKDYEKTAETGAVNILILLILFAVYSYIIVDEDSLDQDTIALRNILLLAVIIQIFAMLHPLSMRINYYFLVFVPVLIPKIVKHCNKKYIDIARISVAIMTIYFFYNFLNKVITDNDPLNVFPYIPFWK